MWSWDCWPWDLTGYTVIYPIFRHIHILSFEWGRSGTLINHGMEWASLKTLRQPHRAIAIQLFLNDSRDQQMMTPTTISSGLFEFLSLSKKISHGYPMWVGNSACPACHIFHESAMKRWFRKTDCPTSGDSGQ